MRHSQDRTAAVTSSISGSRFQSHTVIIVKMAVPAQLQYSIAEKVDILLAYVSAQKDAQLAAMLYAAQHPGRRVPTHSTCVSVFNQFRTTGSVHAQRNKRRASATDVFDIDVLAYFAVRPEASVREIASAHGASPVSVWR